MVASWWSLFINFAEAPRIRFGPSIKITPSWCRRGKRAQQTRPFWGEKTYLVGFGQHGMRHFWDLGGVSNLFKLQSEANRCQMRHPGTIGADWCRQYRTGAILKLLMNIRQWESEWNLSISWCGCAWRLIQLQCCFSRWQKWIPVSSLGGGGRWCQTF